MMKMGRVGTQSAVPWWAAFGAPLIGVPLLVLLLALGSPAEETSWQEPAPVDEQVPVEVEPAAQPAPAAPATLVKLDVTPRLPDAPYC